MILRFLQVCAITASEVESNVRGTSRWIHQPGRMWSYFDKFEGAQGASLRYSKRLQRWTLTTSQDAFFSSRLLVAAGSRNGCFVTAYHKLTRLISSLYFPRSPFLCKYMFRVRRGWGKKNKIKPPSVTACNSLFTFECFEMVSVWNKAWFQATCQFIPNRRPLYSHISSLPLIRLL